MTKVQRERLVILRDFLRDLKLRRGQRFDMDMWGRHSLRSRPTARMCGTAACAAGWATTVPALRKQGLRLRWFKWGGVYRAEVVLRGDPPRDYADTNSRTALERFFGCVAPFSPSEYVQRDISPQDVAAYINHILAENA